MKLTIRKPDPGDPGLVRLDGARGLHAWTSYDVEVVAADFAAAWDCYDEVRQSCTLSLSRVVDGELKTMAECVLTADPMRRQTRVGKLVLGDEEHLDLWDAVVGEREDLKWTDDDFLLEVRLGAATNDPVLSAGVPVSMGRRVQVAATAAETRIESTSGLWTTADDASENTVDATTFVAGSRFVASTEDGTAIRLPVADRSQTHYYVNLKDLANGRARSGAYDVVLVPTRGGSVVTEGLFEAYVAVTTVGDDADDVQDAGSWSSWGTAASSGPVLGEVYAGAGEAGGATATKRLVYDYDDSGTLASSSQTFIIRLRHLPFADSWRAEFRVDQADALGAELAPADEDLGVADTVVPGAT